MSTQPGTSRRPAPLPVLLTRIFGREREAADLRHLLLDSSCRIVTLTGPGGIGKTRLALCVAGSLRDRYDDDVAFVQLSAVEDRRLVFPAIGQAFGLLADIAEGYDEQLLDLLRDRRTLILLDNCEQIPDIHDPVGRLLAACPNVSLVATSQAPLGIAGEQLYPLPALAVPPSGDLDPAEVQHSDAVALFLDRARAVNPYLAVDASNAGTIAEICRYLEGLPLAIELAAARSNVLSPAALRARLGNRLDVLGGEREDMPERLRTMRRAISWSYDLLAPEEQALFRRLAVFEERFSLDSVEAIFDTRSTDRAAIDVLGTLVDRSLVRRLNRNARTERYLMLRTLRDFGLEQLEALGEEQQARLAHARVMTALAETAEPHLVMSDQDVWLDRLDEDRANLRAAIEWSLAHGHEELVFRIAGSIWRFCAARGLISECRAWLDKAFAAQGNHLTQHRTKALIGAGYLADDQRDLDAAQRLFTQARHLAAAIGDTASECRALIGLGTIAHDRSEYEPALTLHREALNMARTIGDTRSIAISLANLGAVSFFLGKADDALRYWEESRAHFVEIGDTMSEAISLMNTGATLLQMGEYARAEKYDLRALALQRQLNVQRDIPFTLMNLAEAALMLGDLTLAHDSIAEAISLFRELGAEELLGAAYNGRARIALVEGQHAEAAAYVLESMEQLEDKENQLPMIENAELMAELCAARGMHTPAVELARATELARERIGASMYDNRRETMRRVRDASRAALREDAYMAALAAGSGLDTAALARRIASVAREVVGRRHQDPRLARPAGAGAVTTVTPTVPEVEHNLTAREVEVLTLLAHGNSTQQIADQLFVSPRTAATHINNILGKLEVNSRTAAVAYAMRIGLV